LNSDLDFDAQTLSMTAHTNTSNVPFAGPIPAVPVQVPPPARADAAKNHAPVVEPSFKAQASEATAINHEDRDVRWVWEVPFDRVTLAQAVDRIDALVRDGRPRYVITANLNYVMLHHRQDGMQSITQDAALILADGQPIVWRSRLGSKPLPERVAGSEMIYDLAERAQQSGWGIYFLGGEEGVAQACADKLRTMYPGLKIAGVESPPFRALTAQEQAAQDDRIQKSGAKILLVAFGQPKGERWIHQNYQRLGVPVSIQLGASFDFIAGTAKRAPEIWQKMGMEWFYRMASDPKRLVPRYAANISFLASALINDWKRKVTQWGMGQWVEPQTKQPAANSTR
jgi:N-acetylglucosaminyldiphosphoundecaprenol N-acetyl-beta-D-mannosaminyltransferase